MKAGRFDVSRLYRQECGNSVCLDMDFEYDPDKDLLNQVKHGISLEFGASLFDDEFHLLIPSIRPVDGEERYKIVGQCGEKLYTAVYVWRGDVCRFISVRRSNNGEERAYRNFG